MLLIYELTTFASQNDVQNHHKNIGPRFGLNTSEEGRPPRGPSRGFATEFHKDLLMNYFPFLISTHYGGCRIFFYRLMCFWHYPRQYRNIVMCTYFYTISMTNSITSHMQSSALSQEWIKSHLLVWENKENPPPFPLSPLQKNNTNYQKPNPTGN